MSRPFVLRLLQVVLISCAVLVLPLPAHASLRESAGGDPVGPEVLAALVDDGSPARLFAEGQYSPDHERILFRKLLPETHPYFTGWWKSGSYWAMRADGTEQTRFGSFEAYDSYEYDTDAVWASNTKVTWTQVSTVEVAMDFRWMTVGEASGGADSWKPTPFDEQWFLTTDGRFQVFEPYRKSYWPGISATEVATGVTRVVFHWASDQYGRTGWDEICRLPDGSVPDSTKVSVEQALAGPDPICNFHRPTPTPTPGPTETPLPSPTPAQLPAATSEPSPSPSPSPSLAVEPSPSAMPAAASWLDDRLAQATPSPTFVKILAVGRRLTAARVRGLTVRFESTAAGRAKAWLIERSTGATLGRGSVTFASGTGVAKVRLSGLGKRTVVDGLVRIAAIDGSGRRTILEYPVSLRR